MSNKKIDKLIEVKCETCDRQIKVSNDPNFKICCLHCGIDEILNEPTPLDKINELMAVEVHGYEQIVYGGWYLNGKFIISVKDFSPTTDLNQAMECLIKSEVVLYIYTDEDVIYMEGEVFGRYSTVEELALLICKAIIAYKGIKLNDT